MSESITDKLSDAANKGVEQLKKTFAEGHKDQNFGTVMGGGERGGGYDKDRTQTSAGEDAHDLASAAERKTNEGIDQIKEATQETSERADDAYKGVKGLMADESDQIRKAVDDMKARAADTAPGHDTQDPRDTNETGVNAGFEVARDMAEKTEDVLGA
ncbi:hypothetical protein Vretimale_6796 [Volvox reticuliferus]|uniref:Uncharacterized protein n=1 Tax=Volvox reticuliferus TaxID=1737510 RepID=A0A8J4G890_9CHLO|nr:hypothetical protein Vretifemale_7134 [Volvox reticuliferus]GIM02060.1 hypothetical protein Vretimale_6796 [Volvox reticuliferus]